jgi:hypothetical protein
MTIPVPLSSNKSPRKTPGLTRWQEQQLRLALRRAACSETWVDDQIVNRICTDAGGDPITLRVHDPTVFPPGGKRHTPMRWCRCCGRYTPPPAIHLIEHRQCRHGPVISATLHCDDCRIADDFETYRELYEAGLHLRPAGSKSFVGLRNLRKDNPRR